MDGPSLSRLEQAIQEVKHGVAALLQEKRKTEPDANVEETARIAPQTSDPMLRSEPAAEPEPGEMSPVSLRRKTRRPFLSLAPDLRNCGACERRAGRCPHSSVCPVFSAAK